MSRSTSDNPGTSPNFKETWGVYVNFIFSFDNEQRFEYCEVKAAVFSSQRYSSKSIKYGAIKASFLTKIT